MKNLKLILGLVVVMMTTIGVNAQVDNSKWVYSYSLHNSNDVNVVDFTYQEYTETPDMWDENDDYIILNIINDFETTLTLNNVTFKLVYGDDNVHNISFDINIEFTTLDLLYHQQFGDTLYLTFNQSSFDYDVVFNSIGIGYLNIFEHEQTNTTVTSYNKELTIKSSEYQNVDVQIYNMGGQMVNTLTNIELGYSDTKVNMYDNPNGVYFILVKDNYTGKVEKHKVMIQ